jgi:4-amino-4-deoxy-L-arabinose transferase-like glycosyltransferase
MKNKHLIFIIIGIITLIRLIYINYLPLLGDEAYYWQWARHLDWGYYEQGPMTALVIWIFTFFTKINTVFTIRLGAVLLSLATMITAYFTYKRFKPSDTADKENLLNTLLMNSSLIYAIGSVLMMHDTVMVFFYALFLYSLTYIIEEPENNIHWGHAGILLGLGIMSKLTMGTVYLGVATFLLLTGTFKKYLKGFIFFTLFTVLLTLPYIYWNFVHDFATVKYLFIRGGSQSGFTLKFFIELLGSQAGLISPMLFILFIPVFIKNIKKPAFNLDFAFATLFWVTIIPFFILSLKNRVEANWPAFTFLPLFFLATGYLSSLKTRIFNVVSPAVILSGMLIIIFAFIQAVNPIFIIPEKYNPLKKTYGFKELAAGVDAEYQRLPAKDRTFLSSRHYQMSSLLGFYMPKQPEFYILIKHESNKNYRFWTGYEKLHGFNCLFVYSEPWESWEMAEFFKTRIFTKEIDVAIPGISMRKYYMDYFEGLK